MTALTLIVSTLRSLRGLRKLHIIFRCPDREDVTARGVRFLPGGRPALIPGARALFSLRNLTDFQIHNTFPADYHSADGPEVVRALKKVDAAFKHFNHGLLLAQQGQVVSELYTNINWDSGEMWPAMGTKTSVCGPEKGCLCVPDSDDDK